MIRRMTHNRYNKAVPLVVRRQFVFNGLTYLSGDLFDAEANNIAPRKLKTLINNGKLSQDFTGKLGLKTPPLITNVVVEETAEAVDETTTDVVIDVVEETPVEEVSDEDENQPDEDPTEDDTVEPEPVEDEPQPFDVPVLPDFELDAEFMGNKL